MLENVVPCGYPDLGSAKYCSHKLEKRALLNMLRWNYRICLNM